LFQGFFNTLLGLSFETVKWHVSELLAEPGLASALVHIDGVGNYALSLNWADGHSTGIYSFRMLRALCPCEACGGEKR